MSRTRLANLAVAPLIFLLPLAAAPDRLLHPAPWLGLAVARSVRDAGSTRIYIADASR